MQQRPMTSVLESAPSSVVASERPESERTPSSAEGSASSRILGTASLLGAAFLLLAPDISRDMAQLVALVLLLSFAVFARRGFEVRRLLSLDAAVLGAGWALIVVDSRLGGQTVGACLLLFGVARLWAAGGTAAQSISMTGLFLGVLAVCREACLWLMPTAAAPGLLWSRTLGSWSDKEWLVGPTYQGGTFLFLGLVVSASRFLVLERRFVRFIAIGLALLAASAAQLFLLDSLATRIGASQLLRTTWLAAAPLTLLVTSVGVGLAGDAPVRTRSKFAIPAAAFCGSVAAALLAFAALAHTVQAKPAPKVLFYAVNEGPILNWDKPTYGSYGPYSLGIYGLLVDYLIADGYQVEFLREAITSEALEGTDTLVTFNANTAWSESELLAVWEFVDAGGSLMVFGDHTGVDGSLGPQNDLLAPYGIAFRFDSAFPASLTGWSEARVASHAPFASLENPASIGTAVGASLELLGWTAEPLVFAPRTLSDLGEPQSPERNYLGDYRYQPGEQLGDCTLVAWARHGKGKVIVHGDTSGFQNALLGETYEPYVRHLFCWASGDAVVSIGVWGPRLAGLLALLLGSVGVLLAREHLTSGAGVVLLLLGAAAGARAVNRQSLERPPLEMPSILIDKSHVPRIARGASGRRSLNAFETTAQRSGYFVRSMTDLDAGELEGVTAVLAVAPMRRYSPRDVEVLLNYMEEGGFVIVCASQPEADGVEPLLREAGLTVTSQLIGPIPLMRDEDHLSIQVEYTDAWVVAASEFEPSDPPWVYGAFEGRPLSILTRVGRGGLFLVGDSAFFGAQNMESFETYSEPNILFLRSLLADMEEMRQEVVQ